VAKQGQATRRERFLPYRYERFGLQLTPQRCVLDDAHTVAVADAGRHLVDLSEFSFREVQIDCTIEVPAELVARVVPPAERRAPPLRLLIADSCGETLFLDSVSIAQAIGATTRFDASIRLKRADVYGSVQITPHLARASDNPATGNGYAAHAGMRLASSRPWEIRLDQLRPSHGEFLDIRYTSFSAEDAVQFQHQNNLYRLECHTPNPILWLNADHAKVCEALDSNANVGRRAYMRDVFFDSVSYAVWLRLFLKSAHDAVATDELPYAWERAVLDRFLPALYPEQANYESQLGALREELSQDDESYIIERLDELLQQHIDLAKHMTKLAEAEK